jgi:hypothetical protein
MDAQQIAANSLKGIPLVTHIAQVHHEHAVEFHAVLRQIPPVKRPTQHVRLLEPVPRRREGTSILPHPGHFPEKDLQQPPQDAVKMQAMVDDLSSRASVAFAVGSSQVGRENHDPPRKARLRESEKE